MSLGVSSVITNSMIKALPQIANLVWPLLLFFVLWIIYKLFRLFQLQKAGIFEIDKMTGEEFERRLAILFTNLGYKVIQTGKPFGDYGVDLVVEKDGKRTAVQAKCYKKRLVREDAVREVYSGMNYYKCGEAMVVTNSNYSRMAWILAKSNGVKLWNRNYLAKVLITEKKLSQKN